MAATRQGKASAPLRAAALSVRQLLAAAVLLLACSASTNAFGGIGAAIGQATRTRETINADGPNPLRGGCLNPPCESLPPSLAGGFLSNRVNRPPGLLAIPISSPGSNDPSIATPDAPPTSQPALDSQPDTTTTDAPSPDTTLRPVEPSPDGSEPQSSPAFEFEQLHHQGLLPLSLNNQPPRAELPNKQEQDVRTTPTVATTRPAAAVSAAEGGVPATALSVLFAGCVAVLISLSHMW
jgi:hypothetical protein